MSKLNNIKEKIGLIESQSKTKVKLTKVRKLTKEQLNYYGRLQAKLYSSFNERDWEHYFHDMYLKANSRAPKIPSDTKSRSQRKSIIRRVLHNYSPMELKNMIDFLFLANHDIKPKPQISIYTLSGGFLEIVSINAQSWEYGDYKTNREASMEQSRTQIANNREWSSDDPSYTSNNSIL